MESTKDMLAWMDIEQSTIDKIRAASLAWIFGQHLQVFYTTLAGNQEEASWLWNCLISSYSDDTLLMHLKASICSYDEYLGIHELMEEYDLSVLQMTNDSTVPKITSSNLETAAMRCCTFSQAPSWYTLLENKVQMHSNTLRNAAVLRVRDYLSLQVNPPQA